MGATILKWTVKFAFTVAGAIIVWAVKNIAVSGIRQMVRHPRTSVGAAMIGSAVYLVGWEIVVGLFAVLFLGSSIWYSAHRASFERFLGEFARTWWRRWWTYSRVWSRVMRRCGLVVEDEDTRLVPRLKKVVSTVYWDTLTLATVEGQELADYQGAAQALRWAFKAQRVLIRETKPAGVDVELMRRDPFLDLVVPAASIPDSLAEVDFSSLHIGTDERFGDVRISLVGGHTAVVGLSGGGKAGVQWNVLRGLGPALVAGLVAPAFIDPKARELRQARAIVATEDYAVTAEETIALLQRLVDQMNAVNVAQGDAGERDFTPSVETPLRPIFVDELAPLLSLWSRTERDKCTKLLQLLLTQGRAAGYIVIGSIQESTKDEFTIRDLFARRIGLRLPTESYTNAALAEDAVDRGAECHKIPESLPGVAFSLRAEDKVATRLRLGHVTTEDIRELVAYVLDGRSVTSLDSRRRSTHDTQENAA
ncbi:MAG: hypothetical protein ABIO03_47155 [Umezawaea sp.]